VEDDRGACAAQGDRDGVSAAAPMQDDEEGRPKRDDRAASAHESPWAIGVPSRVRCVASSSTRFRSSAQCDRPTEFAVSHPTSSSAPKAISRALTLTIAVGE
jgi:hypothetical protein